MNRYIYITIPTLESSFSLQSYATFKPILTLTLVLRDVGVGSIDVVEGINISGFFYSIPIVVLFYWQKIYLCIKRCTIL